MNFSDFNFRCSSLGYIMTDARNKGEALSESCKTHLVDVYVSQKYNRQSDVSNRYIQKGLMVEEDSITLFSRVKKRFFKKNEDHLHNAFIKGTPDLYTGKTIHEADHIIDIKSSWDIFTFFRVNTQPLNKMYYWQLQGYMSLSGAQSATLAYCLVNTPEVIINDEKRKLMWKMGVATDENDDFRQACEELDRLMHYDDIPMHERIITFSIERNDADIERLRKRVADCREYLNEMDGNGDAIAEYDNEVKATIIKPIRNPLLAHV